MVVSNTTKESQILTRITKDREELWDPVRQQWVLAEPEEWVRQRTLQFLMGQCAWPRSLIAVEKDLRSLPYLQSRSENIPQRRIDILCYKLNSSGILCPSLMIECKAIRLGKKAVEQAVGYNHYVQATYVVLVNQNEVQTAYYDPKIQAIRVNSKWPQSLLCSS
ncbi:MAG: hypothetical protein CMO81_05225 [Waddliaceae bacterium]|nr:hypothetical protein [Waddliaceae bacterium]